MSALRGFLEKTLAVALLVAAIAGAWLAIGAPIAQRFTALEAEAAELETLRDRYRAHAARRAEGERALQREQDALAATPGLLEAENGAVAAARMQSEVAAIIEATGAQVRRVAVLESESAGAFEQVGLRFSLLGGHEALRDVLHRLEIEEAGYRVDRLEVRTANRRGRGREDEAKDALTLRFDVFRLRRAAAPSPTPSPTTSPGRE